ncbi:MAG: hypothetical protein RLZZ420_2621 [Bacteroidota bacterium]
MSFYNSYSRAINSCFGVILLFTTLCSGSIISTSPIFATTSLHLSNLMLRFLLSVDLMEQAKQICWMLCIVFVLQKVTLDSLMLHL